MMYEELVKRLRETTVNHNEKCESCSHEEEYPCCVDCLDEMHTEAADAIEELSNAGSIYGKAWTLGYDAGRDENSPRWIPVTEKLPTDQRPVLVYVSPYTDGEEEYVGYVGMAYFTYSPNGGFWCGADGNIYGAIGFIHEPSYWMPLPEPPKEET